MTKEILERVPGTYGDSFISRDGIKAVLGANDRWYGRLIEEPHPRSWNCATPGEAIRIARTYLRTRTIPPKDFVEDIARGLEKLPSRIEQAPAVIEKIARAFCRLF